ncbi:MAG: hypothetical protein ABNH38_16375, partial [Tateyamaria sp.]|uniref:hypothetical protein n=1 Tax=Tateyamaria sp. TaxID=1929288 RepID=UPI0032DCF33A
VYDRTSLIWVLVCFVVFSGFIILRSGNPTFANVHAGHDDALFLRLAENIRNGYWLGPFDRMTLAKGAGLPWTIALANFLGVRFQALEALIYAMAVGLVGWVLRAYGMTRWAVIGTILLLFANPHLWHVSGTRLLREELYTSCLLIALALIFCVLTLRFRAWMRSFLGVMAGLACGLAYLTREEDIWLAAILAVAVLLFAARALVRGPVVGNRRSAIAFAATGLAFCIGFTMNVGPVLMAHHFQYDRAIVSEFRSPEFKSAVGALMRIGDRHPSGYVYVTNDAMEKAFEVSEAASNFESYWQSSSLTWSVPGASLNEMGDNELYGNWFVWALRDATAKAGHYKTADTALGFYERLASELNSACDEGKLECRSRRDTIRPELNRSDLERLFSSSALALWHSIRILGDPIIAESSGSVVQLSKWDLSVGPIVASPDEDRRTILKGWLAHPMFLPAVSQPDQDSTSGFELELGSSTDVDAYFADRGQPDMKSIRFAIKIHCPDGVCAIEVGTAEKRTTVSASFSEAGPMSLKPPFVGYLDQIEVPVSDQFPKTQSHQVRFEIIRIAVSVAQIAIPLLVLSGTLGVVLYASRFVQSEADDPLAILVLVSASAVIGRSLIIGYIDITSWRAVNVGYLGPAYPFVIIYAVAGSFLLGRSVERFWSDKGTT